MSITGMLAVVALASASSNHQSIFPLAGPSESQLQEIAFECGASIRIVSLDDLPVLSDGAKFGFEFSKAATAKQKACVSKKIPSTRVGFITVPEETKH